MNKKILKLVEDRLLKGERKYGNENVTNDGRDFIQEALEEALDCAVYVSAKLVEIQKQNKGVKMGRAIDMENDIGVLKRDIAQLKTAFEGLASTVEMLKDTAPLKKSVNLHEKTDSRNVKAEGKKPKKELVKEEA